MTIRPTHLISRAPLRSLVLPLALAGAVALGACGNAATASPAAAPTATIAPATGSSDQASTPVTATGSAASGSPAASTAPTQKVNANTASQAEIQQALEAAGVPNAARWAREVEEYRPYPTNDPSFAKLRQELAKYNPAPGVVDQIVATVTL